MTNYTIAEDIHLAGTYVKTFPKGIEEAFTNLMEKFGYGHAYYGLSWMNDQKEVQYYTMAAISPELAAEYGLESFTIEKGVYRSEQLKDWMSQLECIKDIFHRLMGDGPSDRYHPCIEIYETDTDMICLYKP